jgi:hypothetical protein
MTQTITQRAQRCLAAWPAPTYGAYRPQTLTTSATL